LQIEKLSVSASGGSASKRPSLQNPFSVSSSSSGGSSTGAGFVSASGYPQFTNFTAGFKDLLDYVFIPANSGLHVLRTAPLPSEEELRERTALPSAVYPSDHVALALDLTFAGDE
jgi:mRNA deadenylase 3'-5' endonuclease subunit Ccr4